VPAGSAQDTEGGIEGERESLMAYNWFKAVSEAEARTHDSFTFVDAAACLAQDDCDEILVIRPDSGGMGSCVGSSPTLAWSSACHCSLLGLSVGGRPATRRDLWPCCCGHPLVPRSTLIACRERRGRERRGWWPRRKGWGGGGGARP